MIQTRNASTQARTLKGVELFAGGGGLLLGSSKAEISHLVASEWDKWACKTMRENANNGHPLIQGVQVLEGDVRDVKWKDYVKPEEVDIVTGGPPCQPFSLGGLSRSADDPRDMFPAATSVIDQLKPKAFVIENVKGLTRSTFADYFEYVKLRLSHPELRSREGEMWHEHFSRLEKEHLHVQSDLRYNVVSRLVNAADYGIPQHRHRVFLIGFRSDVDVDWEFPKQTHSGKALAAAQADGSYWDEHKVAKQDRISIRTRPSIDGFKRWLTVRDALRDLPDPTTELAMEWPDHDFRPGAKVYPGHTGSPIDEPSKALKAGAHGVPGGENMIRFPNGSVRYFTVREAARIQTFPDDYALHGAWGEVMRQLGNAVPVDLGHIVTSSVHAALTHPAATNHESPVWAV
ncbi:DNA (cytosine-5-)-methyltransferase [Corynebacterium sp. MSK044]|uniref:DNA cytosine methyltransferase n=1 Tax=unclassified Corynebacterium TaxID=2624378 RepID=UPI00254D133A|nr:MULTISPECIES: DNA (cytosine-5-)-methyltransferase [unclassified Corynebacterium]MDK8794778.1 DNA (cytosine-5-)-methyltransferase [Corynebacterium sp. MSK041]MDK8797582.1 DNA (cytosine-5-)-methyltransferase [Corynebacterium sp. MSK044]